MYATVNARRIARRNPRASAQLRAQSQLLERRRFFNATPHVLAGGPLNQNWENTLLLSVDGIWDNVPSIEGFTGGSFTVSPGIDPQTLLGPDSPGVKQVDANVTTSPSTYSNSGIAEIIMNPQVGGSGANTVAFQGGGSGSISRAPYLKFYLDATDTQDITVRFDLIDIDGGTVTAGSLQQVAVQYRVGTVGNFTNLPAGYVAAASDAAGTGTGKVTAVTAQLPSTADGQTHIEVRVITADMPGADQLIAVDNIRISATPLTNPPGEFSLSAASYSPAENSGNLTVVVNRLNGVSGTVTVDYTTFDASAVSPSDFLATSGTLTFAQGIDSLSFTIPIVDNATPEGTESFTIVLTNPTNGATLGTPSTATVNIVDDDPAGVFSLQFGSYTVREDVGNASFTVRRLGGSSGAASVDFQTSNGSAVEPGDFINTSGTINFADGQDSLSFTVPIVDDLSIESTESFTITLSNPTNFATLGSITQATVNILDDDTAGVLNFNPTGYTIAENGLSILLTVTRTQGIGGAIGVTCATVDGTALADADYLPFNRTLSFAEGETTKFISVQIVDDLIQESNEQFSVVLSDPTGGATIGPSNTATITITNDDLAGAFNFTPLAYNVSEGTSTVTLTVTRDNGNSGPASVAWATVDGTATAPGDFTAASGVLNFVNGETEKIITVSIIDDPFQEPIESFGVVLSDPVGATLGSATTATVSITSNDVAGQLAFDPVSYSPLEGSGTLLLTVKRTLGSSGPVSVSWASVNGSANAPGDFIASSGTLDFADGETSKTISITLVNDNVLETNESFTVVLTNPTNNATLGIATASVVILDDDANVPSGVILNEINLNPSGSDLPWQFVELRGPANFVLHNVYILEMEGDIAQNPGRVNSILSLEGATFGSNGLLLVRSASGFAAESASSGVFNTTAFDVGGTDFQPGTNSIVLVFNFDTTFTLTVGTDLDSTNSGTLGLPGGLIVLDSVGAPDGSSASDRVYGPALGPVSNDPLSPDAADGMSRFFDNTTPNSAAAWFWGNLVGGTGTKTYTTVAAQRSPNFPVGGILTPGGFMLSVVSASFDYTGSSQSVVVTFSKDVSASLAATDFELVNLTAGNASVELSLLSVSPDGTTARLGFANTGGLNPAVLADGDYQFKVKAGEVSDGFAVLSADSLWPFYFKNADLNHDRTVGFDDLLIIAQGYGIASGATFAQGDVNYDGQVGFDDLLAMAQLYGQTLLQSKPVATGTRRRGVFADELIAMN